MIHLEKPLHDIERALLAVPDLASRKEMLAYQPLKIAVDKAKYFLKTAFFGEDVDYCELRQYPSKASARMSHPILLMEHHKLTKSLHRITEEYGTLLYNQRMELIKTLNKSRTFYGSQALSVMWLPDLANPLDIHTLDKEDAELTKKIKTESPSDEDVPRSTSKLDTKLAKNRPFKKRPTTTAPSQAPKKKRAARMQSTA